MAREIAIAMSFTNQVIEGDDIPSYEQVELTLLPREAMIVNMISTTIFFVIFTLVGTMPGLLGKIPNYSTFLSYWLPILSGILMLSLWWIYKSHQYKGYALREQDIIYKTGVIWRRTTILPFNRIQHVETQQGVLQRKYNLAKLQLFTAGGQRADLTINGMDFAVTEGIKNRLLRKIQAEAFPEE